ncbi:hypothetical protein N1851_007860 [Merluccius polli]|uniref:HAT C-terminal dimerisation domain-containing protein n=1 Tax=Merluccius polli TaxID=89951 RepID=A0AA47N2A0_MERPO|nr:hypothetical protein N1851_007860 [Merluccius polli]
MAHVKAELICKIQVSSDEDGVDCLEFWKSQSKAFPRLYPVAMRVLAVPATSAPVERVIFQEGERGFESASVSFKFEI